MDSSTPPSSFQPINLQDSPIVRRLDPWEMTRVMEHETSRLLNECFPGWVTSGDPVARDDWRLLCQELILQSGTLICDAWQILHPEGTVEVNAHTGASGVYLIIDMKDVGYRRQVYLVTTVLYELRRKRWMGTLEAGESFSFLETLRAAYHVPANAPQRSPAQLPGEFAAFFVRSWKTDLVNAMSPPKGSDDPSLQTGK